MTTYAQVEVEVPDPEWTAELDTELHRLVDQADRVLGKYSTRATRLLGRASAHLRAPRALSNGTSASVPDYPTAVAFIRDAIEELDR